MQNDGLSKFFRWIFIIAMWLVVFTGFGNMPLYGRYYVADLPGMAWSGDFIMNVQVHYICGAVLLGLSIYYLISYVFIRNQGMRLTSSGMFRAAILALALITGLFMALKNLPGTNYPLELLVFLNLFHMAMAMVFILTALVCLIGRFPWTRIANLH
jgi:hypothetical protein